jgi:hypothetical protein
MKATRWEYDSRKWIVIEHTCAVCGWTGRNRSAPDDDFDQILALKNWPGG